MNTPYYSPPRELLEDRDNVASQIKLGEFYENTKDYQNAEYYYLKAYRQGSIQALVNLGLVSKKLGDDDKALEYFLKADNFDNTTAQYNLGILYEDLGDTTNSIKYYLKAASKNHIDAQFKVGITYLLLLKNLDKAEYWLLKAANKNYAAAQTELGLLYLLNKPDEEEHDLESLVYASINGTKYSPYEAEHWLLKAAEQNYRRAQYNLGYLIYSRVIIKQDLQKAEYWLLKAAKQNYLPAQYRLGILYNRVKKDHDGAEYWLLKAAFNKEEQIDKEEQMVHDYLMDELGKLYELKKDYISAINWYLKSQNKPKIKELQKLLLERDIQDSQIREQYIGEELSINKLAKEKTLQQKLGVLRGILESVPVERFLQNYQNIMNEYNNQPITYDELQTLRNNDISTEFVDIISKLDPPSRRELITKIKNKLLFSRKKLRNKKRKSKRLN